jgi:hypothetical protein
LGTTSSFRERNETWARRKPRRVDGGAKMIERLEGWRTFILALFLMALSFYGAKTGILPIDFFKDLAQWSIAVYGARAGIKNVSGAIGTAITKQPSTEGTK